MARNMLARTLKENFPGFRQGDLKVISFGKAVVRSHTHLTTGLPPSRAKGLPGKRVDA